MNRDELLEAIRQAEPSNPEGAQTALELAETVGRSTRWLLPKLAAAIREGTMEAVRIRKPRLDGAMTTVVAYRVK